MRNSGEQFIFSAVNSAVWFVKSDYSDRHATHFIFIIVDLTVSSSQAGKLNAPAETCVTCTLS